VTIKRPTRPFKGRRGRPSLYDVPNMAISTTGALWKVGHVFSTAPDIIALQSAAFPATELRRRAAAEKYFKLNRAELKKGRTRDAALRDVASRFHIDAETFVNWVNRSGRTR
jgi:hypothetical protein